MQVIKRTESLGLAIGWSVGCVLTGFILAKIMSPRGSIVEHRVLTPGVADGASYSSKSVSSPVSHSKVSKAEEWLRSS